jgi:ribosome-binding factor A
MADPARAKKIADRIKVLVAETLEYRVKDERLGFITITDVRVTGDLQNASVFYTVFGGEAERADTAAALESAKGKLRSAVGKGIGIRLTPTLDFIPDALPEGAAHMEDLLLTAKQRDAEVSAAAAGAADAGDADPYKKVADGIADDDNGDDTGDDATDDASDDAGDDAGEADADAGDDTDDDAKER